METLELVSYSLQIPIEREIIQTQASGDNLHRLHNWRYWTLVEGAQATAESSTARADTDSKPLERPTMTS